MLALVRADPAGTLAEARRLVMPRRHDVRPEDIDVKRLGAVLALAHDRELRDFASLLLVEQLGPRTLQSLALDRRGRARDADALLRPGPLLVRARREGRPSVPRSTRRPTIESIAVLRRSLDAASIGDTDKIDGMARLNRFVRALESSHSPEADVEKAIAHERRISPSLGGRTVLDDRKPRSQSRRPGQLGLFDT